MVTDEATQKRSMETIHYECERDAVAILALWDEWMVEQGMGGEVEVRLCRGHLSTLMEKVKQYPDVTVTKVTPLPRRRQGGSSTDT